MEPDELRRLIVRHRHVAPMLSVLLAGTDARVTITDVDETVILDRQGGTEGHAATVERHPILVDGTPVGWVAGPRPAGAIATVLSYACAREADKRSLAREALDRYRELNLIYDLADQIGAVLEIDAVARVAVDEAAAADGRRGFVRLREDADAAARRPADRRRLRSRRGRPAGILGAILVGDAEIVNDVAARSPGDAMRSAGLRRSWRAPLRVRGERIGVIGTLSREPVEYHALRPAPARGDRLAGRARPSTRPRPRGGASARASPRTDEARDRPWNAGPSRSASRGPSWSSSTSRCPAPPPGRWRSCSRPCCRRGSCCTAAPPGAGRTTCVRSSFWPTMRSVGRSARTRTSRSGSPS
jgi:hypothetical protein